MFMYNDRNVLTKIECSVVSVDCKGEALILLHQYILKACQWE